MTLFSVGFGWAKAVDCIVLRLALLQVDDHQVHNWVPQVGSSTSGSTMSFVVNALEADRESKELRITCITSHPPYTGPLEYVDIQRQEVRGE